MLKKKKNIMITCLVQLEMNIYFLVAN